MGAWKIILIVIACIAAALVARGILAAILRSMVRRTLRAVEPGDYRGRVLRHYKNHGIYELMFAWFKTRLDPMFSELPELFSEGKLPGGARLEIRRILDLGCGFGFAGSFLLEYFSDAEIWAIEPSAARVAGAAKAFRDRGHVDRAAAPEFENSNLPDMVDIVFILDVIHFLSDDALDLTLKRVKARLRPAGMLIIRAPMQPAGAGSVMWNLDRLRRLFTRVFAQFRNVEQVRERLEKSGFDVAISQMSGDSPELFWFISTACEGEAITAQNAKTTPARSGPR